MEKGRVNGLMGRLVSGWDVCWVEETPFRWVGRLLGGSDVFRADVMSCVRSNEDRRTSKLRTHTILMMVVGSLSDMGLRASLSLNFEALSPIV